MIHEQFIQHSELHNRLLAASRNLHRFKEPEAAFIRDMAERFEVEGEPMTPTPLEALFLTPDEAERMSAITCHLVMYDIAWRAGGAETKRGQGNDP